MGYEARARCDLGTQTETVKALLESDRIILRGQAIRRQIETVRLAHLRVHGEALVFEAPEGETVVLHLGTQEAGKWMRKLQAPAPTLAAKLGIGPAALAAVYGMVDDEALAAALEGAVTSEAAAATVLVAVLRSEADLNEAVRLHAGMPCRGLWAVHEKGSRVALPSASIRNALREMGYKDHKVAGVSPRWTATRYAKP